MTINKFCQLMRRKLVTFEHHIIIKQKIDLNESKSAKEWFGLLATWIKFYSEQ